MLASKIALGVMRNLCEIFRNITVVSMKNALKFKLQYFEINEFEVYNPSYFKRAYSIILYENFKLLTIGETKAA